MHTNSQRLQECASNLRFDSSKQPMKESKDAARGRKYSNAATHCNTLQHTAAHCNTLQHTATHCITLTSVATPLQ